MNSKESKINILLGSRSFYEGWDSNRPNIINFINIGGEEAKKFVLQCIGRGVRIQPKNNIRKRLPYIDEDKEELLETLFIYATNKTAIGELLDVMKTQKNEEVFNLKISKNNLSLDLYVPEYADVSQKISSAKFNISKESLSCFDKFFYSYKKMLAIIVFGLSNDEYDLIDMVLKNKNDFFQINQDFNYKDYKNLVYKIKTHFVKRKKYVSDIRLVQDEDILHYKNISYVISQGINRIEELKKYIDSVLNVDNEEMLTKLLSENQISIQEFTNRIKKLSVAQNSSFNNDIQAYNIAQHYYIPLIIALNDKVDYLKHIINEESEINFIKQFAEYIYEKVKNIEIFRDFHEDFFYMFEMKEQNNIKDKDSNDFER